MTMVARAQGLTCRFGRSIALDGVDLHIADGESAGLIGPNGSGRTTLLQILATLRRPDAGTIEIAGVNATRDPFAARAHVMYVGCGLAASAGLRVVEYLQFVNDARRSHGRNRTITVNAALERSQLPRDARVETLSPGLQQQLALTAALLVAPRLLLLDDAFASLDHVARDRFLEWVGDVRAAGTAVVAAVNSTADLDALSSTLLYLENGKLTDDRRLKTDDHINTSVTMTLDLFDVVSPAGGA